MNPTQEMLEMIATEAVEATFEQLHQLPFGQTVKAPEPPNMHTVLIEQAAEAAARIPYLPFEAIKADFAKLWDARQVGETLVVATPFVFPNDSVITVCITHRDDRIIITDGESLSLYMATAKLRDGWSAALDYLKDWHEITVHEQNSRLYYFKETKDPTLVSSNVFDVATFIQAVAHAVTHFDMADEPDPYESPEYAAFVEKMAERCERQNGPCDGCLAGSICDGPDIHADEPEYDEDDETR